MVVSSLLPVRGRGPGRRRRIEQVNAWLRSWCHTRGFGFCDHGCTFEKPGLLGADGIRLTKRGKRVFANKLAGLTRRALN